LREEGWKTKEDGTWNYYFFNSKTFLFDNRSKFLEQCSLLDDDHDEEYPFNLLTIRVSDDELTNKYVSLCSHTHSHTIITLVQLILSPFLIFLDSPKQMVLPANKQPQKEITVEKLLYLTEISNFSPLSSLQRSQFISEHESRCSSSYVGWN